MSRASTVISNCSCMPGYFVPTPLIGSADGLACFPCVAGKYKPLRGSSECSNCPANSFTVTDRCMWVNISYLERQNCNYLAWSMYDIGARSDPAAPVAAPRNATVHLHDCRCEPGYSGEVENGECAPCAVATYKETYGKQTCAACEACTQGFSFSNCTIRSRGKCDECKNGPAFSDYLGPGVIRPVLRAIPHEFSSETLYTTIYDETLSYPVPPDVLPNVTNMTAQCTLANCSCNDAGVSTTNSPWGLQCGCSCVLNTAGINRPAVEWEKSHNCTDVLQLPFGIVTRILQRQCYKTWHEPGSCSWQCSSGTFANGESFRLM